MNSVFETYTDDKIDEYDVVLANQVDSDYYSVDFPSAITDAQIQAYRVQIMKQVGGIIDADANFGIAQGEIQWNGSKEVDLSVIFITDRAVENVYEEGFQQPPVQVFDI